MDLWYEALDGLSAFERDVATDSLHWDQRLKIVEIRALLAIAQQLSAIHHQGINSDSRD